MTKAPARPAYQRVVIPDGFLHAGQIRVLNDPARFKIVRAGRRWRKSGYGVVQALFGYDGADRRMKGALDGGHVGWWVPSMTARYIVADWEPLRALASQIDGTRVEEANHRVILPTGGSVIMLTGDNPDSGRGLGLDGAVLDETTLLAEQLWTETVRPTLIDRRGWAAFLFTPKGLDWVYRLETDVSVAPTTVDGPGTPRDPDWAAFHYRTSDNPAIDPDEVASLERGMSTLVRRQEIDAEYVTFGAGMFYRDWFRYWWAGTDAAGEPGYFLGETNFVRASSCRRFSTVDLAWSQEEDADFTVIATWAVTPQRSLILLDVVRDRIAGPDIVRTMQVVHGRLNPGYFRVERATRQLSIIQEAVRAGLPVREIRADKDKVARALPATAYVESGRVWFPRVSVAPQMDACEAELVAFPMGEHDDFVDVLAYAVGELSATSAYGDHEPVVA